MKLTELTSLECNELELYSGYTENQLFRINEPAPGVFIAESPEVIDIAIQAGYELLSVLADQSALTNACSVSLLNKIESEKPEIPVFSVPHEELKSGYGVTRGVLAAFRRKTMPGIHETVSGAKNIVILEDVMNPTNTGAIFRSAAALGVDAVLLTGGCADPLYRRAARVSMGNVFKIPWTYVNKRTKWPEEGIGILKELGFSVISLALNDRTVDIRDEALKGISRKALVLGTEESGIRPETLELSDFTVKIPMAHNVDSLNVAAASAVAFWELCNK